MASKRPGSSAFLKLVNVPAGHVLRSVQASGELHYYRDCAALTFPPDPRAVVIEIKAGAHQVPDLGVRPCVVCLERLIRESVPAVVCGWCRKSMRPGVEPVTHGICPDCVEKFINNEVAEAVEKIPAVAEEQLCR